MNLTSEAYQNYKDRLLGLTFSERFLTPHYVMDKKEKDAWVVNEEKARKIHFDRKITVDDIATSVEISSKFLSLIKHIAREFSYTSLISPTGMQDTIKGTIRAHASLNKRSQVCSDDLKFLFAIQPYLTNPFSPYEGLVVKYRAQGLSYREIERKIGKRNYVKQISLVVKKAELRGILESESPQKGCTSNRLKRNGEANYG
jgi:hypothetical protein